jgi:hypothetical protein
MVRSLAQSWRRSVRLPIGSFIREAWLSMLWGDHASVHSVKFLVFAPLLALLGAIVLSTKKINAHYLFLVSLGQLLFYGFLRWKLNQTFGDRLLLQIEFNLGLWLTLYAIALLCLLQLAKALQPKSKW